MRKIIKSKKINNFLIFNALFILTKIEKLIILSSNTEKPSAINNI